MTAASYAPYPHQQAITDRMTPVVNPNNQPTYWDGSSHTPIDTDTYEAWRQLTQLFADIQADVDESGWDVKYGLPARLECFWDPTTDHRGIAIFDGGGQLIVHVLHALLGYMGSGPILSRDIMTRLGVSREMFEEIQNAIWNTRPYKVVLSRQQVLTVDGVAVTSPTLEVMPEWTWWRVS